jgi:uncharacterized protein (TIGR03067 family)
VIFDGDVIQTKFPMKSDKGRFKLDPSKAPKQITDTWDAETGIRDQGEGIYEFDGDTLKICFGGRGKPRPTSFDGGAAGAESDLLTLRREGRE